MAETTHTEENISYIRTHVDLLQQMQRFMIASNPQCIAHVEQILNGREGAAAVYLKIAEGSKSLDELVKVMKKSKPTISKVCTHLYEQGLIGQIPDPENKRRYCTTDVETLLGVTRIAKRLLKK